MGDTLHKMQVIIEATTEPLKKGMENSRREVKKSVEEIQKETEKVKNPFKGIKYTLECTWTMLSRADVAKIDAAISPAFFSVTFTDPGTNTRTTKKFYSNTPSYQSSQDHSSDRSRRDRCWKCYLGSRLEDGSIGSGCGRSGKYPDKHSGNSGSRGRRGRVIVLYLMEV